MWPNNTNISMSKQHFKGKGQVTKGSSSLTSAQGEVLAAKVPTMLAQEPLVCNSKSATFLKQAVSHGLPPPPSPGGFMWFTPPPNPLWLHSVYPPKTMVVPCGFVLLEAPGKKLGKYDKPKNPSKIQQGKIKQHIPTRDKPKKTHNYSQANGRQVVPPSKKKVVPCGFALNPPPKLSPFAKSKTRPPTSAPGTADLAVTQPRATGSP